jgi:hypothetical protein
MEIQHEGEEVGGRTRAWSTLMQDGVGGSVLLQHHAIDIAPEEDFTDTPDTHLLSWEEWEQNHGEYGLNLDGTPVGG